MQTSQVSNPVNVLSAPAPASKQSESNAPAEPFGKVLSREVADRRSTGETTKAPEKDPSKAAPQQTRNDAKPSEAKSAKDAKSTKETKSGNAETAEGAEATENAADVASQVSEDLLALVANLTQMQAPVTETTDTAQAAQDAAAIAANDATAALAAAGTVKTDAPAALPIAITGTAQDSDTGVQRRAASALDALTDRIGANRPQRELTTTEKAELPATATSDLVAKGQELLNGTSAASPGSAASRAQDFAAAMKESTSAITTSMQPAQQAALHAVQTTAANAAEKLTPSVGTPAWDQALGQKVVWMVAGGQQSATLTLNPPDLGPLQVVLNVSNSQANATFIAAQPEVRQALEAALPKLRDMLGDAGIQLGQASVNSGTPNQQGTFDQQASQSSRNAERTGSLTDAPGADTSARVGRVQPAQSRQGLVDTFV